jgi:hypothetical protein
MFIEDLLDTRHYAKHFILAAIELLLAPHFIDEERWGRTRLKTKATGLHICVITGQPLAPQRK